MMGKGSVKTDNLPPLPLILLGHCSMMLNHQGLSVPPRFKHRFKHRFMHRPSTDLLALRKYPLTVDAFNVL